MIGTTFHHLYKLTGETLGEGSYGSVKACRNIFTGVEYAAKIIEKIPGSFSRSKVLKEIEIYHICRGHRNIIQLIEFFEETDKFVLVFEKVEGGSLLKHIQRKVSFTEAEASMIIKDVAEAIKHLHDKGVAHRDIKPDNILCMNSNSPCTVKLCDFDLCSPVSIEVSTPPLLSPVGSLEYMAPEVADTFLFDEYCDEEEDISYTKKCDMWSLGIILYILLSGYAPFSGTCGSSCGWESGEPCLHCQELLLSNIIQGDLQITGRQWDFISGEAKDLIGRLLEKNSSRRLSAQQLLDHPWIINRGSDNTLCTPSHLKRQTNIQNLEDFAERAIAVNRALEEEDNLVKKFNAVSIDSQDRGGTNSAELSPTGSSNYKVQRGSKGVFPQFSSIDEIGSDFFMKNI